MSFFRPGFSSSTPASRNVHEDPSQNIQGGLPGEHYHLSAAMLDALIAKLAEPPLMTEAVLTNSGDLVHVNSNDLVYVLKAAPYVPVSTNIPGDGGLAPVPYTPAPVPDVVSPPAPVPAPTAEHDTYFNQVVALSNMDVATGTATVVTADLYGSSAGPAGAATGAVGSHNYPLYGNNTLEVLNPAASLGSFAFLNISCKQSGGTVPVLYGAFTYEQYMAMVVGGTAYLDMVIGAYTFAIKVTVSPSGTGHLRIYNDTTVLATAAFTFNWTNATFYHFTLERNDDGLITFYVNGVVAAQMTYTGSVYGIAQAIGHVYGPYRITKGIARFNGAFTPPSSIFLTA